MADAGVAAWDTKYAYWYPRPENAIRDSGIDPGWRPLLPHPGLSRVHIRPRYLLCGRSRSSLPPLPGGHRALARPRPGGRRFARMGRHPLAFRQQRGPEGGAKGGRARGRLRQGGRRRAMRRTATLLAFVVVAMAGCGETGRAKRGRRGGLLLGAERGAGAGAQLAGGTAMGAAPRWTAPETTLSGDRQ